MLANVGLRKTAKRNRVIPNNNKLYNNHLESPILTTRHTSTLEEINSSNLQCTNHDKHSQIHAKLSHTNSILDK